MSQTQSPFQFLAPYGADKKDSFWGRDQEINRLYELTNMTNLIMVYGSSGTGKTSLIQSGLSKKLSGPDWIPLFIRRGENFITSLTEQLGNISKLESSIIEDHLSIINRRYYRPVYLFLDQFEEVFTLSDKQKGYKDELSSLFKMLNRLQSTNTCKIIIIIREEFLGLLYESEQYLPNLFDFRLRVEPMNKSKIEQVITGTFREFKIQTDPVNLTDTICEKLVEGQANGQLAYLQVYLEKLWKEATKSALIDQTIIIRKEHVDAIKDIQNVLDVYLTDQQKEITSLHGLSEKSVKVLLDLFVTEDSTKRPRTLDSLKKEIGKSISILQLQEVLKHLEASRLLILEKDCYELAHDILAKIIDSKRQGRDLLIKNLKNTLKFNRENKIEIDRVVLKQYDDLEDDADFDEKTKLYVKVNRHRILRQRVLLIALQLSVVIASLYAGFQYFQIKEEKENAVNALNKQRKAELDKKVTEDRLLLKRIEDILINGQNCPDGVMLDSLRAFEKRSQYDTIYKNEIGKDLQKTLLKWNKSKCSKNN
ncbi:ATP-binding protein [Flectobacillus sp. BAB-3569]|uniref:nSTAND1 domain-containing NTPase n=1 Tax=Flectobacillus sp. BAB-3569 TaxID=1509483 RepID=UPI000BA2E1ED|nr:ATP-binding protein [Flectobacillus sp. BAB-3569]PAC31470.1 hypothetical protein BWI92_09040 [Flectobacillus sp. BAB-3569]